MTVRTDILPEELTREQEIIVERQLDTFARSLKLEDRSMFLPMGERMRQPKAARDIEGLYELIDAVLQDKQNAEGIVSEQQLEFTEEYPTDDLRIERITFSLQHRQPGSISGGKPYNSDVQELKPHVRDISPDPNNAGYMLVTTGQKFESRIVLTCWAKTNKRANYRARWLEDTLREYNWFVRYQGIEEFLFMEQQEDLLLELDGKANTLKGRPLIYYARTERLGHVSEPTLRRLVLRYGIGELTDNE